MSHARLNLEFRNYWHAGSGKGAGHHVDALCERDHAGLPTLPGRQLKGLLRNAVHRAESWGWLTDLGLPEGPLNSHEELLFGSHSHSESRDATVPGLLQIDSAYLPESEWQYLAEPTQALMRKELFGELFSTAINESGSAQRFSLRGLEVCIPLTLHASLQLNITAQQEEIRAQQQDYLHAGVGLRALEIALPLLDNLGAHRTRGLGEAVVTIQPIEGDV